MKLLVDTARSGLALAGITATLAAAPLAAMAETTPATAAPKAASSPCFFVTQWDGWKSPKPDVIYLGVNMHDVYEAVLSAPSTQLGWPDMHLVSQVRGPSSICSAIDLQLAVSDGRGFYQPLIVKSLRKLSPEEAAAIPKQFRPN